jgi:AraC-like DNA-binding protein
MLSRVDDAGPAGQDSPVETNSLPALAVHVERGRSALRVVAHTPEARPAVLIEATFSGGPEGVWFRLTQGGEPRLFSRDAIARHPALSAVLRLIADEVDFAKPKSEALLAFLFRSLLVYVGRISTPVPLPRWGRPLRDARVEKALELLNADIAKRWTVDLLARAVGLSRPAFARQFSRMLGLSPMRYLTQKRLQLAASLLLGSDASLAEIAGHVGYQSEFAFNRAFKRQFEVPPGVYRQRPTTALHVVYDMAA